MITITDSGMGVYYDGKLIHSHYSHKVWSPSQIEASVQRVIEAKMPQPKREKLIREGGAPKDQLDAYFDSLVGPVKTALLTESEKHRKALSYERMTARKDQLGVILNGLPAQVEESYTDEDGNPQTRMIDNPQRAGFEAGHVMLDGLPEQIEQPTYDAEGTETGTEMVANPERVAAQAECDTVSAGIAKTAADADVMAIVTARAG